MVRKTPHDGHSTSRPGETAGGAIGRPAPAPGVSDELRKAIEKADALLERLGFGHCDHAGGMALVRGDGTRMDAPVQHPEPIETPMPAEPGERTEGDGGAHGTLGESGGTRGGD